MKNAHNNGGQNDSSRGFIKRWLNIVTRRRNESEDRFQVIMAELQDIKDSVEIMAQQMARWSKVLLEE